MNEIDIVRDISRKFEQAGVAHMLTGSMAMNYYAQPCMTRGVDIVVSLLPKDVEAIVRIFGDSYFVSEKTVRQSVVHRSIFNLIHQESVIKVDCIVRKPTEYRVLEFE